MVGFGFVGFILPLFVSYIVLTYSNSLKSAAAVGKPKETNQEDLRCVFGKN